MTAENAPRRLPVAALARLLPVAVCVAALAAGGAHLAAAADEVKLESSLERLSYMLGYRIGFSLHGQGMQDIDPAVLAAAIEDALSQRDPRLAAEEMQATEAEYRAGLASAQAREAEANLAAGEAFLASNAGNEGVVEMPGGLQYRILRAGEGPKPAADDRVVVHYRGRLLDGTEFDSSYRRGEPAEFTVGGHLRMAGGAPGDVEGVALGGVDPRRPRLRGTGGPVAPPARTRPCTSRSSSSRSSRRAELPRPRRPGDMRRRSECAGQSSKPTRAPSDTA